MPDVVRVALLAVLVALVGAVPAGAVGPWPGTVNTITSASTGERFSVTSDGTTTDLVANRHGVTRTLSLPGTWRIPAITSTELPGGLSVDGRLLVLAQVPGMSGLRSDSRFAVVSTRPLKLQRTISLKGEFGFDAVSADRRTLYVMEHRDAGNLNAYIVRAYDLARGQLVAAPVVAKNEGTTMTGYPIARATTTRGTWVYTLYWRTDGTTFIHALATLQRRAVCLDLSWHVAQALSSRLQLSRDGKQLLVHAPSGRVVERVATPA